MGNCVIVRTPLRPVARPCQKSSTPIPIGVTGPIPVMTTRGRSPATTVYETPSFEATMSTA